MNIRTKTVLIVQREGEYLVGRIFGSHDLRWSKSPWDAWNTREKEAAQFVARMVGGKVMLFNPVSKEIREAKLDGRGKTGGL